MREIQIVILWLLIFTGVTFPAYAATRNSATCSAANVQSAINASVNGDVVLVPSGNCNWGTATVSIIGKNITVQGAGPGVTNITGTGSMAWRIGSEGNGNSSRITGFTVTVPAGSAAIVVDGDGWRIDHMNLRSATSGALVDGVWAYGLRVDVPYGPTGLIDHVAFVDARPLIFGFPDVAQNSGTLWVSPLGLGDANAVYVEDSTWVFNGGQPNLVDCNYGGRWVIRFSTTQGSSIDSHSNQGWRGCRRWEVYNNTIKFGQPYFTPFFIRGGTGTIFNNTIGSGWGEPYISLDNVRSIESRAPLGQCNGSAPADGNRLSNGWPCRDQIGWATDSSQWTPSNMYPAQVSTPAYFWSNTIGGSAAPVQIRNGTSAWIQPNRDYYLQNASFTGASGMGVGTIASRPATCTTGVGYWATNEGEWNDTNGATADGRLYKCTATNTWTLYYTPFTYPHPLQTGSGSGTVTSPPAPQNLTVQ